METVTKTLTSAQERVLRLYQSYCKRSARYKVANKNAHLTIRKGLMEWLAQDLQRETFALEVMPVHEQVELVDVIVSHLQDKRTVKSKKTHAANIKRAVRLADDERQQSLNL